MKTKRTSSPVHFEQLNSMGSADGPVSSFHSTQSRNTSHSPSDSYTPEKNQQSDSLFSPLSDKFQPEFTLLQKDEQSKSVMRLRNQTESVVRKSLSESPLPLNSENSLWESSIPITSEGSQWDSPVPLPSDKDEANQRIGEDGDLPIPQPRERTVKPKLSTGQGYSFCMCAAVYKLLYFVRLINYYYLLLCCFGAQLLIMVPITF